MYHTLALALVTGAPVIVGATLVAACAEKFENNNREPIIDTTRRMRCMNYPQNHWWKKVANDRTWMARSEPQRHCKQQLSLTCDVSRPTPDDMYSNEGFDHVNFLCIETRYKRV